MNFKKHITLILCSLTFLVAKSQLLLPKFEEPVKLEALNSEAEEMAPITYLDGNKLYFVRTHINSNAKERKKGQEIWESERVNGNWSDPKSIFDEANDKGNNGVVGSSKNGDKIYVFNSIQSRRKLARGIAFSQKQDDGSWGDLKKVKIKGFDVGEGYYSFYINPDEDILLISKSASDTTVNEDLFVSLKKDGKWSEIINLGSTINTAGYEISPYIADDKKSLYFASSGHGGLGDADIFVSYRQDDSWSNWSKPLNLGAPINSPSFDAYFVLGNNEEVFFASNRGSNFSDIYTTKITKGVSVQPNQDLLVNGQFNYEGLAAENVNLEIYDENGNLVDKVVTDAYGRFKYKKLDPDAVYFVKLADDEMKEYGDGKLYFIDEEGNLKGRYAVGEQGVFEESTIAKLEEEIKGSFEFKGLPLENSAILVFDDNGNVIDTIYTDANGEFNYKKLNAEGTYRFEPLDISESEKDLLILVDDKTEKIQGVFKYNNLPMSKAALVVLDESGFPLDTFYTDESGKFEFYKLKSDKAYSIKPMDVEDVKLENIDLYLTDNAGKESDRPVLNKDNSFAFVPVKETNEIATNIPLETKKPIINKGDTQNKTDQTKQTTPKPKPIPQTSTGSSKEIIYFEFNKFIIKQEDKLKLYRAAAKLRKDPSLTVTLIGHTDNVGGEKVNQRFSEARAEAAMRFLMVNGISKERISTMGKGQSEPIATNDTREGRAENRRVEVKF